MGHLMMWECVLVCVSAYSLFHKLDQNKHTSKHTHTHTHTRITHPSLLSFSSPVARKALTYTVPWSGALRYRHTSASHAARHFSARVSDVGHDIDSIRGVYNSSQRCKRVAITALPPAKCCERECVTWPSHAPWTWTGLVGFDKGHLFLRHPCSSAIRVCCPLLLSPSAPGHTYLPVTSSSAHEAGFVCLGAQICCLIF
jgi:hypothetical protein